MNKNVISLPQVSVTTNLDSELKARPPWVSEPPSMLVHLLDPVCSIKGELVLKQLGKDSLDNVTTLAAEIRMYWLDYNIDTRFIPARYEEWVEELNELERLFLYRNLVY